MEFMKDMFDMSPEVARAVAELGYETPTPIQLEAIPPMKEGRDVIGQAQTGTGKTAAFGIPLSDMIDPAVKAVQAIVLSPTRELALQNALEIQKLCAYRRGVGVVAVYGGAPIERQIRSLREGAQVVVGTPGRIMDHMTRGTLELSGVRLVVLDEADEMLDMGFRDDIDYIMSATPAERQTALFSATMPGSILELATKYLTDPVRASVQAEAMTVEKIEQYYFNIRSYHKAELLSRLLALEDIRRALVFVNTKQSVETLVTDLQHRGFSAAGLHGDMRQIERDAVMARYRNNLVSILVATDVAARGLDIEGIETVVNYDIPLDVAYYVHRIGRTGRAGKEGRAYTFVVGQEIRRIWDYRRITKAQILLKPVPSGSDVRAAILRRLSDQIVEAASREHSPEAEALAGELAAKAPANALTAAMLDMLIGEMTLKSSPDLDISVPAPAPKPHLRERTASVRRVGPYGRPVPPEMLKQTKAFEHRDGAKSLSRDRSKPKLPHRADSRRARDPRYDQDSRPTTFHKEQKRAYPEHTDTGRRGYKPHERSAQDLRPRKPAKQHR